MPRSAGVLAAVAAIAVIAVGLLGGRGLLQRESRSSPPRDADRGAAGRLPGEAAAESGSRLTADRPVLTLPAAAETEPVPHEGDAADDPAIWIHPLDREQSTIIATDKAGGLAVYDLSGRELQYLREGELNNVDLRAGFPLGGRRVALVAASNRSDDTVVLYRMDDGTRRLAAVGSFKAGIAVYGLCMYRNSRTGTFYVYVDSKQGQLEQWQLSSARGAATARRVRTLDVGGQIEGCVADDALGHLYVAEEQRGIWKYGATPDAGGNRTLVDSTDRKGHLTADVEGLAIAYGPNGTGHLVASSQGAGTFAVYRRGGDNRFLGAFRVGAARGIDGVQDTDGIDVTAAGLGAGYPDGLFVAQDGNNARGNQNFKLVRWPADRFR